jgi:hypothetical protein
MMAQPITSALQAARWPLIKSLRNIYQRLSLPVTMTMKATGTIMMITAVTVTMKVTMIIATTMIMGATRTMATMITTTALAVTVMAITCRNGKKQQRRQANQASSPACSARNKNTLV